MFTHSRSLRFSLGFVLKLTVLMVSLCLSDRLVAQGTLGVDQAEAIPAEAIEFFEDAVRPLLVDRCYECHSGDKASGSLRVDTKQFVLAGGESGPALIPGEPDASRLVQAVRYDDQSLQMPPDGKLSDAEIEIFARWVQIGAPDPRDESPAVHVPASKAMSIDQGREFWSFQRPVMPAIPEVRDKDWVRTPIDAFILAQLEQHGMQPAAMATRGDWLRRATLDLTGLPPTTSELQQFVSDPKDAAYEAAIDRLLASPRYGERWGRHWLDVARYADSNGLDENLAFGNAWRYRDYVIRSFNEDKPFDHFVVEQIAGDLVAEPTLESRTGTGFLCLGAKVLAEPDRMKLTMDTIDEQIDTVGKAFLGLTLGCARCHDHKFDPITQADYYALGAIFKSTKSFADTNTGAIKHWFEFSFADEDERASLKDVDAAIAAKSAEAAAYKNDAYAKLRADARDKAAWYLAAATRFNVDASLNEISDIAHEYQLHPRILHHCRLHLFHHADDEFVRTWYESQTTPVQFTEYLSDSDSTFDRVYKHYAQLFTELQQAWSQTKASDPNAVGLTDLRLELARRALDDAAGFLALPPQPEYALDDVTLQAYYKLLDEARILESNAPDEASVMAVAEGDISPTLALHIRGSHRNLGEAIERDFPAVLRNAEEETEFADGQSGRLELASWIASDRNPLTARVIVNRVWGWHFDRGLVESTENFGVLGAEPSHPQLLDWLATWFIESGWSMKKLHRLIMNSSVYRMSARHSQQDLCYQADPTNALLWCYPMQRMDAEQLRDSILFVSGQLDESLGGKTVPLRNRQFVFNHTSVDHTKYDSRRRAVYLPIIRNNLYGFFEVFDFPDPTMPTGHRNSTIVAPQALVLMNDPLVIYCAERLARSARERDLDDAERIQWLYQTTLGREATEEDIFLAKHLLHELRMGDAEQANVGDQAWGALCQSMMMSNDFIFIR